MKHLCANALLALALVVTGCATPPKLDYSKFYEHQPRSIVVLPPANKTTAVDAPGIFLTTITQPLAERGYYVIPVYVTQQILNDLGLTDESLISAVPPQQFREFFDADAVLYTTITQWSTSYVVLSSTVTVGVEYRLVNTNSGEIIWSGKQVVSQNPQGGGGGGAGLVGALISAAVKAAINTATDYRPLASQANQLVVASRGGLPAGPYHPEYQKDQANYH